MRLKRPRRIRAEFVRHAQAAEQLLRFEAPRNHQRLIRIPRAHPLDQVIHVPRIASVGHGQFVFRGGQPERTDHHGRQRIRKFAFEHRAFASYHAVICMHFAP
jgi:hypothetical protein